MRRSTARVVAIPVRSCPSDRRTRTSDQRTGTQRGFRARVAEVYGTESVAPRMPPTRLSNRRVC